jgi:addiction module RelE/StbE family toxin
LEKRKRVSLFRIFYTPEAHEKLAEIAKQDPKSARIIFEHIQKLPETYLSDPFLKGPHFKGLRRNRTGRYRFIYRVLEEEKQIRIIAVDHRKDIYR